MAEQVPDVIQAKRFELVDDDGKVRAKLGFEKVSTNYGVDRMPAFALLDEAGEEVAMISLDYFNHPSMLLRTSSYADGGGRQWHEVRLGIDNFEARLVMQGAHPKVELQDQNEATRFQVELSGGDAHTEPCVTIRDNQGNRRVEVALDEVECGYASEVVPGEYEAVQWVQHTPIVRMYDAEDNVIFETPHYEADQSGRRRVKQ